MRITRIEIFGFKSFMDRLVLPLESGVTAVVGPNGCGKSNIVDALRWVMGETRARNLRGGTLEDVIFNGTDKLRPLGLAEVTLTIRSSGSDFFSDIVSPALEAELEAEKAEAEVEQEAESSIDEAAGEESQHQPEDQPEDARPHLTVIEGHLSERKAEEGSAAPDTEHETTDEAAQETQPDAGQAPSEAAAEAGPSATLVNRFAWLRSANEVQVTRRLYRSGESEYFLNRVPCRLKDVREFFTAVGLGARAHTIVAQGEVARIVTAKPEERRLILEEAAGVLGFRERISTAERRLQDTDQNIARIDDILKEVTRQVNSLRRQAARARNRKALKRRIAELELIVYREELATLVERYEKAEIEYREFREKEEAVAAKLSSIQAGEEQARSELIGSDVAGDQLRSKIDAIKEELNNRARERSARSSRMSELRAFLLARTTELERLRERRETLLQRREESGQAVAKLEVRDRELNEEIGALNVGDDRELREISSRLGKLRDQSRTFESAFRGVRDNLSRAEGRMEALEKQLVAASPIQRLRESVGSKASDALQDLAKHTSLFIRGLSVPEHLVDAVQAVLAERSQFLVAEQPFEVAGKFVERVLKNDPKNAGGVAFGVLRAGAAGEESSPQYDVPFRALLSEIEVTEQCQLAANRLLQNVYVADDLAAAFSFFEHRRAEGRPAAGLLLVTPAGDLVTDHSFYSLRHEGGVLHLKRRLEELTVEREKLSEDLKNREAEREALVEEIRATEQEHSRVLHESQQRQAKARELSKEQGSVRGRLQSEKRVLQQVEQDLNRLNEQEQEGHRRIEEFKKEQERLEEELAAFAPEDEAELHAAVRELNQEYLALDEQRRAGRQRLSEIASQVNQVRTELDQIRRKVSDLSLSRQKATLDVQHIGQRVRADYGAQALAYCVGKPLSLEAVLDEIEVQHGESEAMEDENADQADTPVQPAETEAGPESAELDLSQISVSEERERLDADTVRKHRAEIQQLRSRIAREGEVDPTSIQRFEEEQARLENLESQKSDLSKAAQTLKKTIERLRNTSKERFLATYHAISENFSRLVPRLFGGGKGELELLDPNNPLESGVNIIARPPGKKLKSIDLLSGGEKALCATALIFSMFLERPSPLCVLDEVDAPLDEANLVRFLSLIKEMSARTQFLMITHNKGSMAVADKLVGVTMEQPGASKVLSVSLQEAYSQVA